MSTGTDAENASGADIPGAPSALSSAPSGLPRRNRAAPPPPRPRETAPEAQHDTHDLADADTDVEDTLSPEALARAMTAIHLGSMRARLSEPDDPCEPNDPDDPDVTGARPAATSRRQPPTTSGVDDGHPVASPADGDSGRRHGPARGTGVGPTPVRGQGVG